MKKFAGLATSRGYVSGPVFLYRGDGEVLVPEYTVAVGEEIKELARFHRGIEEARRDIANLIAVLKTRTGREDVKVFESHQMLLEDPTMTAEVERTITLDRLNAEAAVKKTIAGFRAQFDRMNDAYFRERVRDLDDVERRVLNAIAGRERTPALDLKTPSIIVAKDLTPSETVQLPREYMLGFATDAGSITSHVALLARAIGIPAVTGLETLSENVKPGDTILLDGTNGVVTLNPDARTKREFREREELRREADEALDRRAAGTLKDGGRVRLFGNVHPGIPIALLKDFGAGGIGLYRSEYLWLNRELEPTEEEQYAAYRDVTKYAMNLSPEATITIRTLDIGGDKTVRGITAKEANPFLGNRSIRYLLSKPEVFRTQLRAILRASVHGRICVMYPMVSCLEELERAEELMEEVKRSLEAEGIDYDRNLPIGAMIEVPSAALIAPALAKHVKFFSIGTNDLVQYTLAADRGNEAVAHLYQPLHPAVLELVRRTITAARANGIYVSVCGESAADPVLGTLWAAMGVDLLSMSAGYIPQMAKIFRSLTRDDLEDYRAFAETVGCELKGAEVYEKCRAFLRERITNFEEIIAV